ncbi:ParB family chromosome partitioning protein [Caulobacter ginsengisoli]|uniref:ParB family chromosome partitioning protein n=1 Tax=Caulobacter ginsengisoli TaxID=400775 RepID=A0ABU0IVB3_9CAUL|nr:ParB family chromosome partitioning protein [Caulobacter ginsengisoli]
MSALLGETEAEGGEDQAAGGREIPLELIRRNPDQPRRQFAEAELEELTQSVREKGVLQPVLLRPAPGVTGEYQLVAGERRWRAAQRAGLRAIPAVIRELDDLQVLEIAIIENVQRADLNALEEAQGYKALIDRFGRTQDAVAQVVGKSRPHVANALRLLSLPEPVLALLAEGALSAGHARALVGAADPLALARQVVAKGLNVRETESLAKRSATEGGAPRPSRLKPGGKDTDTLSLENDLSEVLGLGVEILDKGGRGEIRIAYETLEQLDDLCRRLTRG